MAVAVGAASTGAAWVLIWLIQVITNLAFYHRISSGPASPQGHGLGLWVIGVPVVGALLIGLMARFGSPKIRGHGIPEALEAILVGRSLIQLRVAILKPISAALSIGTGGPFGAEGPIIMTGGALGSLFAQGFHLTGAERKTLLVAGAAAGMTAIFGTPIAAVLLALELMLFEWKPRSLIPVAVAVTIASSLRGWLFAPGPVFPVAPHLPVAWAGLACAAGLGMAVALVSTLLTGMVYAFEDGFQRLPVHWMWWPALGAVVVGIGGVIEPRVLGVGYDTIHSLLRGEQVGAAVLGLMLAKSVVWSVALGSGTSGGVLAPLLIIGGTLGAALSPVLPSGDVALWALVGMSAMMGSSMRAPLTATLFGAELTRDYNLLPVLLVGCVISYCGAVLLMRRSILTEKLARRGRHVPCEHSVDPFELMSVEEVMDREVPTVLETTTVAGITELISRGDSLVSQRQATVILDQAGCLAGIITRGDVMRALLRDPSGEMSVCDAGQRQPVVAYADEPVAYALSRMLARNVGRLPVVERQHPLRVVGYLGRASILSARLQAQDEEHLRQKTWEMPSRQPKT